MIIIGGGDLSSLYIKLFSFYGLSINSEDWGERNIYVVGGEKTVGVLEYGRR